MAEAARKPGDTTLLAGAALGETRSRAERHAELFERIVARIHRYFTRLVWDAGEVEDLLQRTLLELERSLRERSYDPARSFNAWMWLKAHTQFAQWVRERQRRMARLGDPEAHAAPGDPIDRVAAKADAEAILHRMQEELGEETYEAFVLTYEGGLSQAEVALAVDLDRKTVRKRLAAAHRLIDRILGKTTPEDERPSDRPDDQPEDDPPAAQPEEEPS